MQQGGWEGNSQRAQERKSKPCSALAVLLECTFSSFPFLSCKILQFTARQLGGTALRAGARRPRALGAHGDREREREREQKRERERERARRDVGRLPLGGGGQVERERRDMCVCVITVCCESSFLPFFRGAPGELPRAPWPLGLGDRLGACLRGAARGGGGCFFWV